MVYRGANYNSNMIHERSFAPHDTFGQLLSPPTLSIHRILNKKATVMMSADTSNISRTRSTLSATITVMLLHCGHRETHCAELEVKQLQGEAAVNCVCLELSRCFLGFSWAFLPLSKWDSRTSATGFSGKIPLDPYVAVCAVICIERK